MTVVQSLVKSTLEMRENNKALESRLISSKQEIANLQQSLEAIRAETLTDPLTGLGNRKYFDRAIEDAVKHALDHGEPLSLLMFDIDHFQVVQRQLRPSHRRPGAAPCSRRCRCRPRSRGPGYYGALWR